MTDELPVDYDCGEVGFQFNCENFCRVKPVNTCESSLKERIRLLLYYTLELLSYRIYNM